MDLFNDLGRALEQGLQNAGTFLETNSALLANTLALDKLSEFDGTEARLCVPTHGRAHASLVACQRRVRARWCTSPHCSFTHLCPWCFSCPNPKQNAHPSR
jgi:hypothetical protein